MRFLKISLLFFLIDILSLSCSKKRGNKDIHISSFRHEDTLFIKIQNKSLKDIWVPYEYLVNYSDNDDTIFLERNIKEKYSITKYYLYKGVLNFPIYTKRQIPNIIYDSVIDFTRQSEYFNQFHLRTLVPIKPDSICLMTIKFSFPDDANCIKAAYYETPFLNEEKERAKILAPNDYDKLEVGKSEYAISKIFRIY